MYMIFRFNVMYVYLSKDGSKDMSYIIIKNMCSQLSEITFHMLTCESF